MKFTLLVLALVATSALAAGPKVPAVVGIWKVNAVTTTTAGTTTPTTTTPTTTTPTTTTPTTTTPTTTTPTTTTPTTTSPTTTTPTTTTPTTTTPTTTVPTTTAASTPTTTTTAASTPTTTTTAASTPTTTTTAASTPTTTTTAASTPTTTTTAASTPTTTTTAASTPTTTTTAAPPPELEGGERHPRFPEVILHRHKRADMVHENEFICSGTLVTAKFVLTTAECATAAASTMGTKVTAGLDEVKPDSEAQYWINMVKKSASGVLAMLEVKQTLVTEVIPWSSTVTAAGTNCTFTYWQQGTDKVIKQVSQDVTTKACATGVTNSICVGATPATRAICTGKSEGGALVCNKKVVGIYGSAADGSCNADVTAVKLYDVRLLNTWLKGVSGASTVAFSALLGVLAVAVTTLFN